MLSQSSIQINPAIGLPGDFASANPRNSNLAPPGGFMAGANGVTIGLACWADSATGTLLSNTGSGIPTGIMHRNFQGLIPTYLAEYGYAIPAGFPIGDLFEGGDIIVKNFGSGAVDLRHEGLRQQHQWHFLVCCSRGNRHGQHRDAVVRKARLRSRRSDLHQQDPARLI